MSTLVNVPRVQNFLFRNYNLPSVRQSHYAGSSQHLVREAIRASSAAPGYYEECRLGDWVHQDGGLLTNNPTAIAIHECRLLWPDTPLQCVISIGTGKFEPTSRDDSASLSSFKRKVAKLVESATDTEGKKNCWIFVLIMNRLLKQVCLKLQQLINSACTLCH